jgi:DNA-binding NarL/FixJ family response regulator
MQTPVPLKIVLVDDHHLFRKGIMELINDFSGFEVIWEAENGKEFIQKLSPHHLPDIVLLDISMPVMDGFETAVWLERCYPELKILALTMHNDDETVLRMLNSGVNGYVLKNAEPAELKMALKTIEKEGSYYASRITEILVKNYHKKKEVNVELSDREVEFLKLACTELPYKSFAPLLKVHPRVVEAIREALFKKLNVVTRVGLVMYTLKKGIVKIS